MTRIPSDKQAVHIPASVLRVDDVTLFGPVTALAYQNDETYVWLTVNGRDYRRHYSTMVTILI